MNVAEAIRRAVPVLAEHGHVADFVLQAWLIRAGLSKEQAHDAARFIPLAFGREVLAGSGVTLSPTYIRVVPPQSEGTELALLDEPFFKEAAAMAPQFGALVTQVAMFSSELQTINQALNAGAQLENLVGAPPVITCDAAAAPRVARPWWKFWA